MDEHRRLAALFRGRSDAWGAVEGRCVREPLTERHWYEHCHGDASIGVYPLMEGDIVAWFGTDIDTGQSDVKAARNVWRALKVLSIPSFVERSKTKGFHVLVFPECPVPAGTARAAMFVAHTLAKVSPKEVYPKQDRLTEDKPLGNYLNVPYAKTWADRSRRVVVADPEDLLSDDLSLGQFVDAAESARAPLAAIKAAAALYRPPAQRVEVSYVEHSDDEVAAFLARLTPLGKHMVRQGPLVNESKGKPDRSMFLLRLARECRSAGLVPEEACAVVRWADLGLRPPKFAGRIDGEQRMEELVGKAWE
ncbi:MAG: TOTE conflict system archaeo-eukaryotic primase domain-containing protein [Ilumatobacteraceae bacterium]